jgi:hypothetical protein
MNPSVYFVTPVRETPTGSSPSPLLHLLRYVDYLQILFFLHQSHVETVSCLFSDFSLGMH